LDVHNVMMVIG